MRNNIALNTANLLNNVCHPGHFAPIYYSVFLMTHICQKIPNGVFYKAYLFNTLLNTRDKAE